MAMRAALTLMAGALAVVGAVTGCGSSEGSQPGEASPAGTVVSYASDPPSDLTSSTTGGPSPTTDPASTAVEPLPPPTISIDLSGSIPAQSQAPPTTAAPMSFPMPEPLATEYQGTGRIIETYGQAELAFVVDSSYPPSVHFGIPLVGWDWEQVDDESAHGTTVWTDTRYSVVGAWDGTRLTLTRPPSPATDDLDPQLPDARKTPTPGCELADAQSAVASDEAATAGLALVGPPWASGGDCYVFAVAVIDNPDLQAVLAAVADRVRLDYLLRPAL